MKSEENKKDEKKVGREDYDTNNKRSADRESKHTYNWNSNITRTSDRMIKAQHSQRSKGWIIESIVQKRSEKKISVQRKRKNSTKTIINDRISW